MSTLRATPSAESIALSWYDLTNFVLGRHFHIFKRSRIQPIYENVEIIRYLLAKSERSRKKIRISRARQHCTMRMYRPRSAPNMASAFSQ